MLKYSVIKQPFFIRTCKPVILTEFIQNQRKLNPRFCRRSYWSLAWSLFHRIVPQCSSICLPYQLICRVINYVCFTLSRSVVQVTDNRVAPIKITDRLPCWHALLHVLLFFLTGLLFCFKFFWLERWSDIFYKFTCKSRDNSIYIIWRPYWIKKTSYASQIYSLALLVFMGVY